VRISTKIILTESDDNWAEALIVDRMGFELSQYFIELGDHCDIAGIDFPNIETRLFINDSALTLGVKIRSITFNE